MDSASISFLMGKYQSAVTNALEKMCRSNIAARIWANDFNVWKPAPQEITNRLGWLHAPVETSAKINSIRTSLEPYTDGSIQDVVLLGMGGSSLAADVFNEIFGSRPGYPLLHILDTTDPIRISQLTGRLELEKTLFLVSSKSGTTLEITSLFHHFYNLTAKELGRPANKHFIFITDEGSPMLQQALQLKLPYVFSNNPNIGGRYSALSLPGIVPAAIIGVDIERLLQNAAAIAQQEKADFFSGKRDTAGCLLGAALGTLAQYGRNKLTLMLPPSWMSFGYWLEQLIAESTGKEGKGILPILNEPQMDIKAYGTDRTFVIFQIGENEIDSHLAELVTAGHPILKIRINDHYDLGGQMFLWEMATAVAAHIMSINPFDQPDVEATKKHTIAMIDQYRKNKKLPQQTPSFTTPECSIYSTLKSSSVSDALQNFLTQIKAGDYVCLQVFLSPSPEIDEALGKLRKAIGEKCCMPVTSGYGPRYLHSTGQLHKGDAGNGLFIQLTADDTIDIEIPDEIGKEASSLTFGTLKAAQALGDWQALQDAKRRVIRFHWKRNVVDGLNHLASNL